MALGEAVGGEVPVFRARLEAARLAGAALGHGFLDDLSRLGEAVEALSRIADERLLACAWPPRPRREEAAAPSGRPVPAHASLGKGRVLVVDDNAANRDLLCRRLDREGCRSVQADGGEEALALLAAGGLDVVLLDLRMPGMDGYEVLKRAQADPAMREVPVIVVSALDDMASVVRCIEMGAVDYLPKPFDPVLLRARVGACLEKKRLRDKELEHLRGVEAVQRAAAAVEEGRFDPEPLRAVAQREDELGQLARVFQRMAGEVKAREDRLRREIRTLRIEIDGGRKEEAVREVTETEVFARLASRAEALRAKMKGVASRREE